MFIFNYDIVRHGKINGADRDSNSGPYILSPFPTDLPLSLRGHTLLLLIHCLIHFLQYILPTRAPN